MPTLSLAELLKYANLQMAAEALYDFNAYANGPNLTPGTSFAGALTPDNLTAGNLHASRMVPDEVALSGLTIDWVVVAHTSNTSTGFSGTLFFDASTNEFVLSFRSTEFIDDAARDSLATNQLEIKSTGFAWGQLSDMEAWYQKLRANPDLLGNNPFSVTGYGPGGHLATAFNQLYPGQAQQVVTFNGAGVGKVNSGGGLQSLLDDFNLLRGDPSQIEARITDVALKNAYRDIEAILAPDAWSAANSVGKMALVASADLKQPVNDMHRRCAA